MTTSETNVVVVSATNPGPTKHDVEGGVDVQVSIEIDGARIDGEVTLAPSDYDRRLSSWGQPDCWVGGTLLAPIDRLGLDRNSYAEVLSEIESAAQAAAR